MACFSRTSKTAILDMPRLVSSLASAGLKVTLATDTKVIATGNPNGTLVYTRSKVGEAFALDDSIILGAYAAKAGLAYAQETVRQAVKRAGGRMEATADATVKVATFAAIPAGY